MKFKFLIIFIFLVSCIQSNYNSNTKIAFSAKGFAYIYSDKDFNDKIIKKKLDNNSFLISHKSLKSGALIKVTNPKTNESIILKNNKKVFYPEFYKILITKTVAKKINLDLELPIVEIIEVKKNKSFVAKKTKIYKEEEKIHSHAPIETVKIDNISKIKKIKKNLVKNQIYIIIGEFYSSSSALILKQRIAEELTQFDSKKLFIKSKKVNKVTLLSGPYKSINLMKNDYIQLKTFGFEELDITINE